MDGGSYQRLIDGCRQRGWTRGEILTVVRILNGLLEDDEEKDTLRRGYFLL